LLFFFLLAGAGLDGLNDGVISGDGLVLELVECVFFFIVIVSVFF
jgi:hypothetical protein